MCSSDLVLLPWRVAETPVMLLFLCPFAFEKRLLCSGEGPGALELSRLATSQGKFGFLPHGHYAHLTPPPCWLDGQLLPRITYEPHAIEAQHADNVHYARAQSSQHLFYPWPPDHRRANYTYPLYSTSPSRHMNLVGVQSRSKIFACPTVTISPLGLCHWYMLAFPKRWPIWHL